MTFGEKVIAFHEQLRYSGNPLPKGISVMNPFIESAEALDNIRLFAKKYLNDQEQRHIILGINPSRFGAGVTGIPFTDTKRLMNECKIQYAGKPTHEISSVFMYEMIKSFGGVRQFYKKFYINSPFPLAITRINAEDRETNCNYYDNPELIRAVTSFMIKSLRQLIGLGVRQDICFCLGIDKNARFLNSINEEHRFFGKIIPLKHPRFIIAIQKRRKKRFIDKYLHALCHVDC